MNKNTIVLVDDDLTINYFHKRLLKIYFDQEFIQTCFNGKQAIDTLLSLNEKLDKDDNVTVLLDLNMPVMNGGEFVSQIHSDDRYKEYRKIPIVGIGDFPETERISHLRNGLLRESFSKAFRTSRLEGCIEKYCPTHAQS